MIFGFRRKKKQPGRRAPDRALADLRREREALETELNLLSKKLNVELKERSGDKTTTLSRYPRRIVELKIQIDDIDRKIKALDTG